VLYKFTNGGGYLRKDLKAIKDLASSIESLLKVGCTFNTALNEIGIGCK
jgi:hypothetical protein